MRKTVIVTGGATGIGKAISTLFLENDYNVVICYNNSEDEAISLTKQYKNSLAIKCDITKENDIKVMTDVAVSEFGSIDILVNNAGVALQKVIQNTTLDEWNKLIAVNLTSCFLTTKACIPYMLSNKQGSIINIASMWGEIGGSFEVAYSASKAGIIGFTKGLAKELSLSNIRVNCVSPGVIDTKMLNNLTEETKNELAEETPLQRLGTPDDIANTVLFLASDKASFITGQILGVNGGMVI